MTKRGRPQLQESRRRESVGTVRLTEREYMRLEAFAQAEGVSVSDAIRSLVVGCLGSRISRLNALSCFEVWKNESDQVQLLYCKRENAIELYKSEALLREQMRLKDAEFIGRANRLVEEAYKGEDKAT